MSLTNSQYESIMREYSDRQFNDVFESTKIKNEIYSKNPRLSEIDENVARESVKASKEMLSGNYKALDELKQKVALLKAEKEEIINGLGYSLDDLTPKYVCKDCKDTGFINGKPCHCFKQAAIDKIYSQSRLDKVINEENFDNFNLDYYSKEEIKDNVSAYDNAKNVLMKCKDFCDNFTGQDNILIYGKPGIGKTYLTHCIAKDLLDKSYSVIYFTADELIKVFEKETFNRDEILEQTSENVYSCDVLIIDDLGTEFVNSYTSSKIFTCINERLLRGNSTVISTNLSLQELMEIYSERTFSRISQFNIMMLFGKDIRIQKKALENN
ncbi:MAG TPA: DNA replication protein DnaC [Lachnospiraceae bacterium]|nr:DNA replication protein DnaC [Lachnospiraceae bacterium]